MRRIKGQKCNQLSALAVAIHVGFAATAWAATPLPQGASVVSGQVVITKPAENSLHINASGGSIVNWQQFSIGSNGQVRFNLPGASSAILNRVVGTDASHLLGSMQSNGRVFLINPNGIVVGAGARIDTNSFIGSTLDMADGDFLAGKLRFLATAGAGSIRNAGVISAGPGGRIALIAPDIENTGIIHAPDGQILLAAGRKLEISSLDFEGVSFEIQAPTDSVLNLGQLLAENGAVSAFAGTLRHSGEIRASRMAVDSDGSVRLVGSNEVTLASGSVTASDGVGSGGSITVQSSAGTTYVAGSLSATGEQGAGGSIAVLGERVALDAGAALNASGASGGGTVLVGGDFQGNNAAVQNASRVYVDAGASLKADAVQSGDGGTVVVWADENTRYYGSLSARGGALGGNGGNAEVSGKQNLVFAGSADLGASAGQSGTLLLDPLDILISNTAGILPSVVDAFTDFAGNVVTLSPTAMNNIKGNVTLQAERHIYFNDAVTLTTGGAGLTATAGGSTFNAANGGNIYLNRGITTTGGAVTLRAVGVSGSGTITTQGGAVDIKTSGSENYTADITTAGGAVKLEAGSGSVNLGTVNAGSGTITVTTTTGSISGGDLTGGTVELAATGGAVNYVNVNAATRVNASSSNSYVYLFNLNSQPLRLGTLTAASDLYLTSYNGFTQAAGGLLTAPRVTLYNEDSLFTAGSAAAPLSVASPRLVVNDLAAPAYVAFSGNPTLTELRLIGNLEALSGTTISGAANLSSLALGTANGALTLSADSGGVSGFGSAFEVDVSNAALNVANLSLTGGRVTLDSAGALTVGTLNAASLNATAKGAVTLGTITTTGSSGISVSTESCNYNAYTGCSASSPITATTLSAGGTGYVNLETYDNGDITVGSLTANSAYLYAGQQYYTTGYPYYFSMRTANNIAVASANVASVFDVTNEGSGNITVNSLTAGFRVTVQAGGSYQVSDPSLFYGRTETTNNNIALTVNEPATAASSYFDVENDGVGDITIRGAVTRPNDGIYLYTRNGNVDTESLSAGEDIYINAGGPTGTATMTTVAATSGSVEVYAGGNVLFDSITAGRGSVDVDSSSGSIKTRLNNTSADISATTSVTLGAYDATNGVIGDASFANPLDIVASGVNSTVTLSAGKDIGAAGKAVRVETGGVLDVTSSGGSFHIAAQTMAGVATTLKGIKLSASAAGIGAGNSATFASQDISLTASSSGTAISIGDIVQTANSLNEFRFNSADSGLNFGNVNLASTGYNQLFLSAGGALSQNTPGSNNISAGNINLNAGSAAVSVGSVTAATVSAGNMVTISGGDITTGNLTGPGISVSGGILSLGSVASTGTCRLYSCYSFVPRLGYNDYVSDQLILSASGALSTTGNISSATSASVSGTGVTVAGGIGSIIAGQTTYSYGTDTVTVGSGSGNLAAGNVSAYNIAATGSALTVGNVSAVGSATLGNTSTTALTSGTITGASTVAINAGSYNTGAISAGSGTLNLTVNGSGTGDYAPGAGTLTAGAANLSAANGIDLTGATLSANSVTLSTETGNIDAALTGTTRLTINTGGAFGVTSSTALTSLNVSADGSTAGAGLGSTVQDQFRNTVMALVTNASTNTVDLTLSPSSAGLANYYQEQSEAITDITVNTSGALAVNSRVQVTAPVANINLQAVNMSGGDVYASSRDGSISLASVNTGGGSVSAYSSGGDINISTLTTQGGGVTAQVTSTAAKDVNVNSINTRGGGVDLRTSSGNINSTGTGTGPLAVDMRNGQLLVSNSTLTLSAAGSIGSAAAPFLTSGALNLNASARDTIEIGAANTALSGLTLTTRASGTGTVNITNSNYTGLSILRSNSTDLDLTGLNPTTAAAFSLTALDGNINVKSDIGNVTTLTLDARAGDLTLQASGGSARNVNSSSTMVLQAGRDVLIASGSQAAESVTVQSAGTMQITAGRDLLVNGAGAAAVVRQSATFGTQTLNVGRNLSVTGGSVGSASLLSGAAQNMAVGGDVLIQGGTGTGTFAKVQANSSQSLSTNNLSVLGGADGAYAALQGSSQSMSNIYGNALVQGGSGSGAYAEVVSTTASQSFGTQYVYFGTQYATDSLSILGGSGAGAYASLRSASSQNVYSAGDIKVVAGSGANADAEIKAVSSQDVGLTYNYYYYLPTSNVLVQASGTGLARILAGGSQNVLGGGTISVLGGSAAGMTASIETTGGAQTVGTSSSSSNDPTDGILVQGGSGAAAWIKASASQSIQTGGNIDVLGGSGTDTTASIESTAGSQSIGYTYIFSNDPTGNITVQGGAGNGAAAWIKAASGQTIDAGGTISVLAAANGATGSYADIVTTTGSQTMGNRNSSFSYDNTDSVLLTGGSGAGSYARVATLGGSQNVQATSAITLTGGAADSTGALLLAASGQTVASSGTLAVTGGTATTTAGNESGLRNTTLGTQNVQANTGISLTGGGAGSDVWIKQAGSGAQSINSSAALTLTAPTVGANTVSITSGAGGQTLNVADSVSLNNAGAALMEIASGANQTLSADALSVVLSSTSGTAPEASVTAVGNQTLTLNGNVEPVAPSTTPTAATLTVSNLSGATGSLALLEAGGTQTIAMNYASAGLMQVGGTNTLGESKVYATGDQTIVVGELLVQGGATAAAKADLSAGTPTTSTILISTLAGPIRVIGGAAGPAGIDPLSLSAVSNGSILVNSGAGSTAGASVTAGIINMTATNGNMAVIGGGTPATVLSTTTATVAGANTFNLANSGGLTISNGSITASGGGTVSLGGSCAGCGLVGPFTLTEVTPVTTASYTPNLLVSDMLAMLDQASLDLLAAGYDLVVNADGTVTSRRRNLNQCY